MFGFLCNAVCALTLATTGCPLMGLAALVGGVFWLIPTGNDD